MRSVVILLAVLATACVVDHVHLGGELPDDGDGAPDASVHGPDAGADAGDGRDGDRSNDGHNGGDGSR